MSDPNTWGHVGLYSAQPRVTPQSKRATVRSALSRRNRISKVATAEQLKLPLHAKSVRPMNLKKLLNDMPKAAATRISALMLEMENATPSTQYVGDDFRIPEQDVSPLLAAQAIAEFSGDGPYTPVRYFSVHEALKKRRRPIMWPWTFLIDSSYQSEFALCNVQEYTQAVNRGSYACAFDLAASFWQVALESVNLVMTAEDGKKYRVLRMPFGIDCASEIMQTIVEQLGRIACTRAGIAHDAVSLYVHIDNIMCVGDKHTVSAWRQAFVDVCKSYDVTLNDEPENNEASQQVEFAGIRYRFHSKAKNVMPRQAFIDGVPTAKAALTSFIDLESCVGKLLYGMAIRQMRAHQFHDFFVWWRRCLSRLTRDNSMEWEARPMIPAKAKQQLTDMIAQVTSNKPVRVRKIPVVKPGDAVDLDDESLPVLVVDATLHGYGGVLYEQGRVVASFGDKFASKAESMGTAEIAAALAMIRHFAPRLQGRKFVLLTDNTSCEAGVRKGASKHLDMDRAAHAIHCLLNDINAEAIVGHVGTDDNVADAVSRGRPVEEEKAQKSKAAAASTLQALKLLGASRVGGLLKEVVSKALG